MKIENNNCCSSCFITASDHSHNNGKTLINKSDLLKLKEERKEKQEIRNQAAKNWELLPNIQKFVSVNELILSIN